MLPEDVLYSGYVTFGEGGLERVKDSPLLNLRRMHPLYRFQCTCLVLRSPRAVKVKFSPELPNRKLPPASFKLDAHRYRSMHNRRKLCHGP